MKRYRICVSVLAAMLTVSTAVFVTGCNTPVSPDNSGNTPGGDTGGTENPGDGGDSSELPVGNGTATITEDDFPAGEFDQYEITWTPAGGEEQPKRVDSKEKVIIKGLNPGEKYTFTVTGVSTVGEPKEVEKTIGEKSRAAAVLILESTDFSFGSEVTHVDITWTPENEVKQPLRVSLSDATKEGVTAENFDPGTYTFTLQGMKLEEKKVTPEIVKPSYSDLLETGYDALEREDYDSAVASFMDAYAAEANNETKMHAALARLAAISVNEQVVTLMRDRIGFASYPRTLNALINTDEWWSDQEFFWESYDHLSTYQEVPSESGWGPYCRVNGEVVLTSEYTDIYCRSGFDQVNSDAWVRLDEEKYLQKIVKENEWGYRNYYTLVNPQLSEDGNYLIDSSTAENLGINVSPENQVYLSSFEYVRIDYKIKDFMYYPELTAAPDWVSNVSLYSPPMLWMAVLLNNNLEGVNNLIDSVLNNVFGKSYDEAVKLINSMDNEPVDINNRFIRLLRLEDQLGGDTVRVTKAELKAITAALDIVKGTLQFLQAYNLDTPLNFLALDWIKGGDINFNGGNYDESYDPFNNGFLTQRSGYTTETAVNTYISALDALIEAYESITADNKNYPSAAKDFLKKYSGYKELATNIKAAIQDGTWCEFPSINNEGIPQKGAPLFRINFGCMKDGFFSMDKLFETKDGKPVFYTVDRTTKVTAENINTIRGAFGIALKNSFWTSIWDNGMQDNNPGFSVLGFCYKDTSDTDKDFGMDIFNFYYGN